MLFSTVAVPFHIPALRILIATELDFEQSIEAIINVIKENR